MPLSQVEIAAVRRRDFCFGLLWKGVYLDCEGQRHAEGGPAHSAQTPDGLLQWWKYGNERVATVLRPARDSAGPPEESDA